MKETDTQRAICDYLARKRLFFWRNNNTAVYDPIGKRFRAMPKYGMRGTPDIIVIKEGRFIGIEVKAEKGRLSEHQQTFKELCEKNAATYLVARSLDDVIAAAL